MGDGLYGVMIFSEKLDLLLTSRGWSQARLAGLIGIATSAVSEMTRGKRRPYMDQALAISRALDVSLDYLADDSLNEDPARSQLTDDEEYLLRVVRALKVDADTAVRAISAASSLPPRQTDEGYLVPIAERDRTDSHLELERLRRQKEREEARARGHTGQEAQPKKLEESK